MRVLTTGTASSLVRCCSRVAASTSYSTTSIPIQSKHVAGLYVSSDAPSESSSVLTPAYRSGVLSTVGSVVCHVASEQKRRNYVTLSTPVCSSAGRGNGENDSRNNNSSFDAAAAITSSNNNDSKVSNLALRDRLRRFFSRDAIVAGPNYNRYLSVPASFAVQLSVGSVYAWSVFNAPLMREFGVVAAAERDWDLGQVIPIFSACALTLGITTATLGPWAERAGPRTVAMAAAVAWGGGLMLTGVGADMHSLPLLYLGYGVMGGMGWGLGYITPVSTLMKWFPDKRGFATGLALTAFGGGAMLATPINMALFDTFYQLPQYLGAVNAVDLVTEAGVRYAEVEGTLREVVVATAADVKDLPVAADPGVYVVGTGSTGAAKTFGVLGASYFTVMMAGAMMQRVPAPGWTPASMDDDNSTVVLEAEKEKNKKAAASAAAAANVSKEESSSSSGDAAERINNAMMVSTKSVHYDTALRTPQLWLLWSAVAGNAIAGVTIMSCAKNIMTDVFGSALPGLVGAGFATGYVAALSGSNMVGRFGWAAASDYLGRKRTYALFGLGVPICFGLPMLTNHLITDPGPMPLYVFVGSSMLALSFYGGTFSVLPAYLADLFGPKHTGAIHGRLLTAWSAAAIGGPYLLATLRDSSYARCIDDLVQVCDPETFRDTFGAPISELQALLDAKTVTIPQLMAIAPPGTLDPTPALYNTSLYAMGGLLSCAFLCNLALRPIDPKYHIKE